MRRVAVRALVATAAGMALCLPLAANAADIMLPKTINWSAYDTVSSGYAQSVGIGNMLKEKYGTTIRVIPGKNDVSRMAPLRDGKVDYCACGIAVYFGQEGVFLFAAKEWGPQPLRLLASATGENNLSIATAADANIKTLADLKGKRIAWVRAGDALNWNATAMLAFAGLTWDDVSKVEVSGFGQSFDAVINGQADAAITSTVSPAPTKLAASPRGLYWPPLPHSDKAGWARLRQVHPAFQKHIATQGANIDKDHPYEGAIYPYPTLVTNASQNADEVYNLTKAIIENVDSFKNSAPGADGWALDKQNLTWALPYHEGAIRYFKEKGVWTPEAEEHQAMLVKRQQILIDTWKGIAGKDGMSDEELRAKWGKARADALKAAGLDLVFASVSLE
jgi:TRAP transporter TAXI family solute receptor